MKLNQFKKRLLIIAFIILVVIALPITVYLVQQQQNLRQDASAAKNISILPQTKTVSVGETFNLSVNIHPSGKFVKNIHLIVNYDPAKLEAVEGSFEQNSSFTLSLTNETVENGKITLQFDADIPSSYVDKAKDIGTLSFRALADTGNGDTEVKIGKNLTKVKGADNKNIDYQFNNSQIVIQTGAPICRADVSTCSWDPVTGATEYHYKIVRLLPEGSGEESVVEDNTSDTKVEFPSVAGRTYKCDVYAINGCGNGTPGSDTATCVSLTPTITPTLTPTAIPTITPTITPTLTPTRTIITPTFTPTPTVIGSGGNL